MAHTQQRHNTRHQSPPSGFSICKIWEEACQKNNGPQSKFRQKSDNFYTGLGTLSHFPYDIELFTDPR